MTGELLFWPRTARQDGSWNGLPVSTGVPSDMGPGAAGALQALLFGRVPRIAFGNLGPRTSLADIPPQESDLEVGARVYFPACLPQSSSGSRCTRTVAWIPAPTAVVVLLGNLSQGSRSPPLGSRLSW